jgi:Flp pilus assembly protein TadG
VFTMNSEIKARRFSQRRCGLKGITTGLRVPVSAAAHKFSTRLRDTEAAELLEFALALPLILVMVAGLLDFSRAYNIKQKLSNAAREGARYESSETADTSDSNPQSVPTLRDDVVTYLTNAGINTSFIGTTLAYDPSPGVCTGTYYTTVGTTNYGLMVERCVPVLDTTTSTTIPSTRVTLYYPYDWTFGFNNIIKLLLPSSTFTNPINIQADATISNFL